MSDEIKLDGKDYISSKRASELSGYAQDYVGQLARVGDIEAERIGGLWYISKESLQNYKDAADTYKPEQPKRAPISDPDSLISFDGKDYISASRASKITGYHQDYVGQLARSGMILSRQIGNRWYVEREAIIAHKSEKDALLGAVQSQSVGIAHMMPQEPKEAPEANYVDAGPYLTYTSDEGDLMPNMERETQKISHEDPEGEIDEPAEGHPIPIHVVGRPQIAREQHTHDQLRKPSIKKGRTPKKTMFYGALAASAFTIVIVLSFGFGTLKNKSIYTLNVPGTGKTVTRNTMTASALEALNAIGNVLEKWLVPELVYKK